MSFWLPLDPVTRESGALSFVAGSHRWERWFQPEPFAKGGAEYERGEGYEPMPDIDAGGYDILSWDMEPGDALAFHAMTVHGAGGNLTSGTRRRGYAVRYCGDGLRLFRRTRPEQRPAQPGACRRRPARQRPVPRRLALRPAPVRRRRWPDRPAGRLERSRKPVRSETRAAEADRGRGGLHIAGRAAGEVLRNPRRRRSGDRGGAPAPSRPSSRTLRPTGAGPNTRRATTRSGRSSFRPPDRLPPPCPFRLAGTRAPAGRVDLASWRPGSSHRTFRHSPPCNTARFRPRPPGPSKWLLHADRACIRSVLSAGKKANTVFFRHP